MSESGRDPLIRLPIDQEIFSQVARAGDTVEDATVASEVISLAREGSVYEIEGAIVFAGYVRNSELETTDESADGEEMEHIHHRLPFTLRVPVESQQPNVINIKSRLSGFALNIVSDNWLNVQGNLEIHGLRADEGYHFRCGGQEEGTAFFRDDQKNDAAEKLTSEAPEVTDEADDAADLITAGEDDWRFAPEEDHHLEEGDEAEDGNLEFEFRGAQENAEERGHEEFVGEKVSEARQGHGWSDDGAQTDARAGASSEETVEPIRNELAHLDRHFVSQPKAPDALQENRSAQNPEPEKEPIASFEFEHQLEEGLEDPNHRERNEKEASTEVRGDEAVEETWRPRFTIASVVNTEDDVNEAESIVDETEERHEVATTSPSVTDSDLWSFVDFNGPEPRYSLKYVVVMEEETMELVAERCGCVTSELERMNPWTQGQVRPGQALYIPPKPFSIPRVPVS